ncbi:transcription factor AP-4 isoform X1 [Microtus pennsylvanicus]|uniref:transcription factor AP-4 isoform X1 n=1 Tax=Microtus pennsylvanicus TaxID=10058 RepID=UPI003F6CB12A
MARNSARQPFSSRRQNTSSLSSRRRRDFCNRTRSSSASSRTRLLLAWACFFICEGQRSRLWSKQATVLESKSILLFPAFGYLVDLQNGFSSIESTCLGWLWRAPGPLDVLWVCQLTHSPTSWGPQELSGSSPKRRRAEDKDEGIGSPDIWEDEKAEDLRREMIELRQQLDKERSVRMMLEEQVRSLEAHMYPEKLKVIAQQVQLQQQQEQVRLLHQEKLEREQQHLRTQLLPPAPTHHPTVIVPAPAPPSHHINVVTMGPSSVINSVSTSRQNLDTIVQAIQHIEGTQDKQELEEEQRRAVIVKSVRSCAEAHTSDTASDSEASDSDAMDQSREEPLGDGELP